MKRAFFHICNPSTPDTPGFKNIVSNEELQNINDDNNAIYLVQIHLNWDGNKLSNNYGFNIANLIRIEKKSKAPIIFYSPIQVEYFEYKSKKEIKYKILFGRGSAFIEAPFEETALIKLAEGIEPLSKAALHDVVTMLCNLKGIVIDKLNHDLKFEADIDAVISDVIPYLSVEQKKMIHLDTFVSEIKDRIRVNDVNGFLNEKLKFITLCNQQLTENGQHKSAENRTKHRILLIDDLPSEIEKAKRNLEENFIIESATTGEQAVTILNADQQNEIVAVISDWRLFTDEKQNYWQPLQGYEVLDFAAKNGIRSLFALTSQADFIVHHLRNLMGIRFSMFKKENLHTLEQWKVFADILFEACEEAELIRSNIPDSDNWKKSDRAIREEEEERIIKNNPERHVFKKNQKGTYVTYASLHEQYLEYRHAQNRDVLFKQVEEKADEVWSYLTALYITNNNYHGVEALRNKFDLETPKDALLFPVLVLRRIWMALWYKHVDDSTSLSPSLITQHSKFIFGVMHNVGESYFVGNKQSVEQTKICISIPQVRNRIMFPEERAWLLKWGLLE